MTTWFSSAGLPVQALNMKGEARVCFPVLGIRNKNTRTKTWDTTRALPANGAANSSVEPTFAFRAAKALVETYNCIHVFSVSKLLYVLILVLFTIRPPTNNSNFIISICYQQPCRYKICHQNSIWWGFFCIRSDNRIYVWLLFQRDVICP